MEYPQIYQMETTNYCNAQCEYCPRDRMTRPLGLVPLETVYKVVKYCKKINQDYIALHHMGEPLLHPKIWQIIKLFQNNWIDTELSTNGILLRKRGKEILDAGIHLIRIAVDYSYHSSVYNTNLIEFLRLAQKYPDTTIRIHTITGNNLHMYKGYGAILEEKTLDNWAGEKDFESKLDKSKECYFLKYNHVVVLHNGDIVPCCMDYNGTHVIGNINNIDSIINKEVSLCQKCSKLQFASDGEWKEQ